MKFLIVKRDKIGDLLLTTPMLTRLRELQPDAQIHVLANDWNAWVVRDHPAVDRLWIYRRARGDLLHRTWATVKQLIQVNALRRERFDVAIAAQGEESPRAVQRTLWARAGRTAAYVQDAARYGKKLTDPLPVPAATMHEMDRIMALLTPFGIAPPQTPLYPEFRLPDSAREYADTWLKERGLLHGQYVVLGIGSRWPENQPSPEQILRWAQRLQREHALATVFMWTPGATTNPEYPGDDVIAEQVLQARPDTLHPFRGPIAEALGLIWGARTSVIPDSGLMHFAAASPGGVVGFFADPQRLTPPARWYPRGCKAVHIVAERGIPALPDAEVFARLEPLLSI